MIPTVGTVKQRLLSRGYNPARWVLSTVADGVQMTFTPMEYQRHHADFLYKVDGYQALFPEYTSELVEPAHAAPYLIFRVRT